MRLRIAFRAAPSLLRSRARGRASTRAWRNLGHALVITLGCASASCGSKSPDSGMPEVESTPDGKSAADGKGASDAGRGGDAKVHAQTTKPVTKTTDDTTAPGGMDLQIDECGADNQAGLSADDVQRLKAGGSSDGMRLLYPYDGTVFPRGLGAPLLMWEGGGMQAVYLHIKSDHYEYHGCLKPDAAGTLQIPKSAWAGAEQQTTGPKGPFSVELTTLDGATVKGPLSEKLVIAQATLKGSIYYNTYNGGTGDIAGGIGGLGGLGGIPGLGALGGANDSADGGTSPVAFGGSVERIKPGKPAEFFSRSTECTGCHSVSANGKRLITKEVLGAQPGYVFAIDSNTMPDPAPLRTATDVSFVGVSPDGTVYLTTAYQGTIGPPTEGAITTNAVLDSILYETDTGNVVANSGFPKSAMMPTFSADGSLATFNDYARGDGHTLALIDYDVGARVASNQRDLYTTMNGYLGWPFVLPDNGAVVFTLGESGAFSGGGAFITPATMMGPKSDLMMVDVDTGQATLLARAMGFHTVQDADAGKSYLPFGAEEEHQSYYPTVSPVAAGGYFWVFFDSIRHYGNKGLRRQLWATAISVQRRTLQEGSDNNAALYGADLSSPAFYVPGQVFETANHRAFTALDPCFADGATCDSGIDCCSGFCTNGVCGPPKACSDPNEACTDDSDCCDKTNQCIGGFCGVIAL